ncbi:MAG: glycoside hydrolase family 97 catalytic domain-containing protein [Terriglobia bacterium]
MFFLQQPTRRPDRQFAGKTRRFLEFMTPRAAVLAVLVMGATSLISHAEPSAKSVSSPTGRLVFSVRAKDGVLSYNIDRGGTPVILPSHLGLDPSLDDGLRLVSARRSRHRGSWKPLYGERNTMPDNYNELDLVYSSTNGGQLLLQVRAFDEGIAFRYGSRDAVTVARESTEFHVPANSFAWEEHGGTEGVYHRSSVNDIAPYCQLPLTIALPDGSYASILEAASTDFPTLYIGSEPGAMDTLIVGLGGPGTLAAGAFTPWRLVMVAKTPGELLESNYLQLDLNQKQAIRDTGWIKPGTVMREVTLSDEGAHKTIDFAAAHRIPYILFDSGWYGPEDYATGDATHERIVDGRGNPAPPLHIQDIVKYGHARGVGVILYVDRRQAMKQRDILFPLYEKWGVVGVKIGFVEVGTQQDTAWIIKTIQVAAKYHLMLDIHDQYRTTGYTRTYPNLLTVEGIRGNEHFPTAEHNATIPFTRYLAGSADYTICYFDKRLKNTHAHQLAMAVISYSPLQSIFWYDKPSAYHGEPEIRWFEGLPTVWDETRVPLGEIGKYAVLARRSGNTWYVGAIGDSQGNHLQLPMSFLRRGVKYQATIYTDDPAIDTATHVAVAHRQVTSADVLDLNIASRGGEAIYLQPR